MYFNQLRSIDEFVFFSTFAGSTIFLVSKTIKNR